MTYLREPDLRNSSFCFLLTLRGSHPTVGSTKHVSVPELDTFQSPGELSFLVDWASQGVVCPVDTSPGFRYEKFQFLLPSNSAWSHPTVGSTKHALFPELDTFQSPGELSFLVDWASEGVVCPVDTSPGFRSKKFQFLLPSNSARVTSNGGIN